MQKRKGVTSQEEGWLVGDQADDPDINSARWRANVVVKGGVELDERPQSTTTVRSRRPEAEGWSWLTSTCSRIEGEKRGEEGARGSRKEWIQADEQGE
jgi:hypothetical protein